jgi:hypothetical protein
MHLEDEKKTYFITKGITFCYKAVPFGLKNTGVTYQCMIKKVFKHQIMRIIKGYVDAMLVKSMTFEQHLNDLKEVFYFGKMLNKVESLKCVFSIKEGYFFGFLVSNSLNPTSLGSPTC